MSIRAIAREVYKSQKRVSSLEDQLLHTDYRDQGPIKDELRQARAELQTLQNMLNNKKARDGALHHRFSR